MPKSLRLFRSTVPGPDTGPVVLLVEYEDMAAYGARTAFENANAEWRQLAAGLARGADFHRAADGVLSRGCH